MSMFEVEWSFTRSEHVLLHTHNDFGAAFLRDLSPQSESSAYSIDVHSGDQIAATLIPRVSATNRVRHACCSGSKCLPPSAHFSCLSHVSAPLHLPIALHCLENRFGKLRDGV